ncbi:C-5 cytosine-specific DNA methylase [Rhizobium leguminosarum bv. trifolii WSM2304]|uniref:DNA (cytosine-5-)-methyltransferase n=1 Tax=Rhizobium leguminosarum bv. trifolii (strain WSM2304) TaxID=395492 RepID=A0ABF7QN76_RHILW|nr:DNA cytosine methyltransferase [Rhizobium leguminosarum]ACI55723.1 C-5 cytosine-specific DNA methylase [Rhizobium leguminosarum bv. trifolii WSM2304]
MARKIKVADLLCGAGGSSAGAKRALEEMGLEMELVCVNHWPTAIDTHQRNFPEARHYIQDIATVRPHILVPEGYLDLLMASPTCTHHSVARGGKPTSDQQRSDPWHIVTWLTELRVKRIIIENVWEFCGWGPVNMKTGRPIPSRKGEYFHAWTETLRRLGFELEWRRLNAADYGDATTRQRFILMGRSDGRKIHWPMPTHRKRDEVNADLFSAAEPWRPAREIIDWSIKGRSILNRKKPLAPKTLARVLAGAFKFGWPKPFIDKLMEEIERSLRYHINWAFEARNAKASKSKRRQRRALAKDLIRRLRHFRIAPAEYAKGGRAAEPMVITLRRNGNGTSISSPIPTVAANGQHVGLAEPVIVNMKGQSTATSSREPLPTQTSHAAHLYAAEPIILSQHNSGSAREVSDPLPTITTGGAANEARPGCARPMLVEPFVLSQASGGSPRAVSDPIPTPTTGGNGAAHALISPYYGSGSGETCNHVDEVLPTITSKGRFGMVVPVTNSNGGATARNIDVDPVPTMTTAKGGEFAFIAAQFGEREGQAPRVHDIDQPTPTIAATGHINLVESGPEYDILFRMLEPHELAAAMGFNTEEATYEFAGTKTEKIKQIGNAVSVAKMKACVGAIMADAVPKLKSRPDAEFLEAAE